MSHIFRLFHLSNLSVLDFCFNLLVKPGIVISPSKVMTRLILQQVWHVLQIETERYTDHWPTFGQGSRKVTACRDRKTSWVDLARARGGGGGRIGRGFSSNTIHYVHYKVMSMESKSPVAPFYTKGSKGVKVTKWIRYVISCVTIISVAQNRFELDLRKTGMACLIAPGSDWLNFDLIARSLNIFLG